MAKKTKNKGMGAVIVLAVAVLATVVILTVVIMGMIKDNGGLKKNEDTTLYSLAGVTNTTKENKLDDDFFDTEESQAGVASVESQGSSYDYDDGFVDVEAGDEQNQTTQKTESEAYDPIKEYENLSKNGDNKLSDHHNNKYIKLISEKYNVDKDLLVAIYSEPDTGNNFVLEFSGKTNEDGNVIKSPDTLVKVYGIDKKKNVCIATGKATGNVGVSYAEGMLCFNMIKTIVMPQYPEYFSGVEK